jgi:hypothetical protein
MKVMIVKMVSLDGEDIALSKIIMSLKNFLKVLLLSLSMN